MLLHVYPLRAGRSQRSGCIAHGARIDGKSSVDRCRSRLGANCCGCHLDRRLSDGFAPPPLVRWSAWHRRNTGCRGLLAPPRQRLTHPAHTQIATMTPWCSRGHRSFACRRRWPSTASEYAADSMKLKDMGTCLARTALLINRNSRYFGALNLPCLEPYCRADFGCTDAGRGVRSVVIRAIDYA